MTPRGLLLFFFFLCGGICLDVFPTAASNPILISQSIAGKAQQLISNVSQASQNVHAKISQGPYIPPLLLPKSTGPDIAPQPSALSKRAAPKPQPKSSTKGSSSQSAPAKSAPDKSNSQKAAPAKSSSQQSLTKQKDQQMAQREMKMIQQGEKKIVRDRAQLKSTESKIAKESRKAPASNSEGSPKTNRNTSPNGKQNASPRASAAKQKQSASKSNLSQSGRKISSKPDKGASHTRSKSSPHGNNKSLSYPKKTASSKGHPSKSSRSTQKRNTTKSESTGRTSKAASKTRGSTKAHRKGSMISKKGDSSKGHSSKSSGSTRKKTTTKSKNTGHTSDHVKKARGSTQAIKKGFLNAKKNVSSKRHPGKFPRLSQKQNQAGSEKTVKIPKDTSKRKSGHQGVNSNLKSRVNPAMKSSKLKSLSASRSQSKKQAQTSDKKRTKPASKDRSVSSKASAKTSRHCKRGDGDSESCSFQPAGTHPLQVITSHPLQESPGSSGSSGSSGHTPFANPDVQTGRGSSHDGHGDDTHTGRKLGDISRPSSHISAPPQPKPERKTWGQIAKQVITGKKPVVPSPADLKKKAASGLAATKDSVASASTSTIASVKSGAETTSDTLKTAGSKVSETAKATKTKFEKVHDIVNTGGNIMGATGFGLGTAALAGTGKGFAIAGTALGAGPAAASALAACVGCAYVYKNRIKPAFEETQQATGPKPAQFKHPLGGGEYTGKPNDKKGDPKKPGDIPLATMSTVHEGVQEGRRSSGESKHTEAGVAQRSHSDSEAGPSEIRHPKPDLPRTGSSSSEELDPAERSRMMEEARKNPRPLRIG